MKVCTRCRTEKSLDDFGVGPNADGRRQPCKQCRAEQRRDPTEKSKQIARYRKWVAANRQHVRDYHRKWELARLVEVRRRQREWYAKPENRAKASRRARAFAAAHPEHAHAKRVNAKAKRRARGVVAKITKAQMAELVQRDRRCYLCGEPNNRHTRSVDHVIPLAKGGKHVVENLRVVHMVCNLRKRDRMVLLPLELP